MKKFILFLAVVLACVPVAYAATSIDIALSGSGLATEDISISFPSEYEVFQFQSPYEPIYVLYAGEYDISKSNYSYLISLYSVPAKSINFSLAYEGLVEDSGAGKVFRGAFSGAELDVSLSLPPGATLSDGVNAFPKPDSITTDGRIIVLHWSGLDDAEIAVFFDDGSGSAWLVVLLIILMLAAGLAVGYYFLYKRKIRSVVSETLSEDEKAVVALLRSGLVKQKEIAAKLVFSKSKMSKVIRKLEEKSLIEKTPFFKTNKLKLKKIN